MATLKKSLLVLLLTCTGAIEAATAITYQLSLGRLGDQLIYYCVARGIAFKNDVSFFAKPFRFWNELEMGRKDALYRESLFRGYERIYIRNNQDFLNRYNKARNQLFILNHNHWETSSPDFEWYGVDHTPEFRDFMRTIIAPIATIQQEELPNDAITVAVHYRTGEGFDDQKFITMQQQEENDNPKFRPFNFYVRHIRTIRSLFPLEKIHVHLFTDAANPVKVMERFKEYLSDPNMSFNTRSPQKSWQESTLEDLFNMSRFDCIIRPRSGFSFVAQLIGNPKIVCHPDGILFLDTQFISKKNGQLQDE